MKLKKKGILLLETFLSIKTLENGFFSAMSTYAFSFLADIELSCKFSFSKNKLNKCIIDTFLSTVDRSAVKLGINKLQFNGF